MIPFFFRAIIVVLFHHVIILFCKDPQFRTPIGRELFLDLIRIKFVQQSLKTKLIVENLKIEYFFKKKHTFERSGYSWWKNATIIVKRIEENFYVCINACCHKRCGKTFYLERKPLKLKFYPPLRNIAEGGNVLDYKAKVD